MKEIIPGIYQLQLPTKDVAPGWVNAYLVQGDGKCLLIDTGWDTDDVLASLKKQLDEIGVSIEDIAQIVLTHAHTDHAGMAGRLKNLSHAQVYLHTRELEVVKSRFVYVDEVVEDNYLQKLDQLLRTHGMPDNELAEPRTLFPEINSPPFPDITLQGGETIPVGSFSLRVIWTPGHSPGQVSLYEPARKLLFSGDLVMPTIPSNFGLHLQHSSNPLDDYVNSLVAIKGLEVALVLPGHEYPFTNLLPRVDELIKHQKQRSAEVLEIMADVRPKTAYQISIAMSWLADTNKVAWHQLSQWGKRFAVLEIVAHLESVRAEGEVSKFFKDDIVYYRRT